MTDLPTETHHITIPVSDEIIRHARDRVGPDGDISDVLWEYVRVDPDFDIQD